MTVMQNKRRWKVFHVIFFVCLLPFSVLAQQKSAEEIAHFAADHVALQGESGTTIYTGHVKMDQGTTHLIAEKVVAYKNEQGEIDKIVATGNPAHYITLPENQTDPVYATGDTIEYYPLVRKAIIIGHGQVTQAENSLKGSYIIYDMVRATVRSLPSAGEESSITLQPWNLPGNKKTNPS
jgi:lipopolysaccharide export system protein LptA